MKFYTHFDGPSALFRYENFSAKGRAGGATPARVNLGPPNNSEITRARKLKFCTHLDGAKYSFQDKNVSARGRAGGTAPPSVNLGPLISWKLLELES